MKTTKKNKIKRKKAPARTHIFYPPVLEACKGDGPNVRSAAELETPHRFFWKTKSGEILRITDMQLDHLLNARALLRRRILRMQETELAMTQEIRRRTSSDLSRYGTYVPSYEPIDEDNDPYDDHGQH